MIQRLSLTNEEDYLLFIPKEFKQRVSHTLKRRSGKFAKDGERCS